MSQPEGSRHRKSRRNSILKDKQNEDVEDGGKKIKRRVSFHNTKIVQKFERDDAMLLPGDQVRQRINETAGSDGILSPGRASHISGSSSDYNNTRAQILSDTMNDTTSMFAKPMNVLQIESLENTAAQTAMDTDATLLDDTYAMFGSPMSTTADSNDLLSPLLCHFNMSLADPNNIAAQIMSDTMNDTASMFLKPSNAEPRRNTAAHMVNASQMESNATMLDNTWAMFGETRSDVSVANKTVLGGDMSWTMLNCTIMQDNSAVMLETAMSQSSVESMLVETDRRDVSHATLNQSGLGHLRSIYVKDVGSISDSLNTSNVSTKGKQRRRSNLVAQLDTSIRSEPRDVTRKTFDLSTSSTAGDTNSHSAETLMKIQRLLQFDPRSVAVAVVEPVCSQKFANVARTMLTDDLQNILATSLHANKRIVQDEISRVLKDHRKLALSKMKLSDLDVVDRDTALSCRRMAEASWWIERNGTVSGHLKIVMDSNLNLEDQLQKLDDDLYLVENSSRILKDTSLLQQTIYDADCLINSISPEEIDQMLTDEQKKLDQKPVLELPELHQGILKGCGIDVNEYEEAVLGVDDDAYLKKLKIANTLFNEQDKLNDDFKDFERKQEEWDAAVRRKENRREERRRKLDSMIVTALRKVAAIQADYFDLPCE